MVVLSTASPFKFPRSVLSALGKAAPENDFEAMQQLEAATGHAAPASLAALRSKPERFDTVIAPAQIAEVALGYQHKLLRTDRTGVNRLWHFLCLATPIFLWAHPSRWTSFPAGTIMWTGWRKLAQAHHPAGHHRAGGDISWAMRLTDTRKDFAFLQQLPGQKIIMKGNHDYWWSTANKMNAYLKAEGFDTLHILHNNSYSVEGYAICGTRGWLFDVGEPHDEKVMNREIGRLRMSLQAAEPGLEKLVFLHYPPVYTGTSAPEIVATLKEFGIKTCFYGHLHGNAIRFAVQGEVDGIRYKLVSADGLRFCPYRIN